MIVNKRIKFWFDKYQELLDFNNLSWWLIDLEDDPNLFYCNKTMCKTFDLDEKKTAHSVSDTCPIAGDYNKNIAVKNSGKAKQIIADYQSLREGEIDEYNNSFPYYDANTDETFYFNSRAKVIEQDEQNNARILFGIIEPEKVSTELYNNARTDGLTGLLNRREFNSQIEFLTSIASRNQHPLSLILCDIDYFKQYNDALGHFVGDECLIQVADAILSECERKSDTAFRYGGEEFAVLVYGDEQDAAHLAEAIRKSVQNRAISHPGPNWQVVTISVGYFTVIPSQTTSPRAIIERADKALYQAKNHGRNRSVQYKKEQ